MNHYDPNSYVPDVKAAEIIGSTAQTMRNWRFQRRGPTYVKKGRMVRYRVQDLLDFMESGRINPEAQG